MIWKSVSPCSPDRACAMALTWSSLALASMKGWSSPLPSWSAPGQRVLRGAAAVAGEAARARAAREAARSGLVRGARPLCAPPQSGVRADGAAAVGRCGRDGLRHDLRPQGLRLLAGLHDLRRLV